MQEPRSAAVSGGVRRSAKVADARVVAELRSALAGLAIAAAELLQDIFGKDNIPCHSLFEVANLPLGNAVEQEVIFEIEG